MRLHLYTTFSLLFVPQMCCIVPSSWRTQSSRPEDQDVFLLLDLHALLLGSPPIVMLPGIKDFCFCKKMSKQNLDSS